MLRSKIKFIDNIFIILKKKKKNYILSEILIILLNFYKSLLRLSDNLYFQIFIWIINSCNKYY